MAELNDIGVSIFIVLLGLDVLFTYKIYNNEYKDNKEDTKRAE
jgi:nitrogen fixation-related uncharacterized protein